LEPGPDGTGAETGDSSRTDDSDGEGECAVEGDVGGTGAKEGRIVMCACLNDDIPLDLYMKARKRIDIFFVLNYVPLNPVIVGTA